MSSRPCPVCGTALRERRLDERNVLDACPACGHLVRDLARCPAGARDAAYGGDPGLDAVRLRLTARRLRALVPPGGRVFEFGHGRGTLLAALAADGYTVAGVDSGQAALDPDPRLAGADLRRGEAGDTELRPGEAPYDAVLAVHVVEHVPDPLAVLRAAHRMLRPGGTLALITPAADSLGLARFGAAWWMLEDPTHVAFFTPASARRALAATGFTAVRVRRPLLESLTCEAASWARRGRTGAAGGAGVLAARRTLALAALTLPVDLAARTLWPRLRPALLVTATRRDGVI